ncbi:MAG: hypothetical protein PWQ12_1301 [Clostridiales bacterium]|nr:hypothetical protein [Clostridiales bacterium]
MTEAMPFLQKAILLSYDPRPLKGVFFIEFFMPLAQSSTQSSTQPSSLLPSLLQALPSFA